MARLLQTFRLAKFAMSVMPVTACGESMNTPAKSVGPENLLRNRLMADGVDRRSHWGAAGSKAS